MQNVRRSRAMGSLFRQQAACPGVSGELRLITFGPIPSQSNGRRHRL
jgi:hypothetical protein